MDRPGKIPDALLKQCRKGFRALACMTRGKPRTEPDRGPSPPHTDHKDTKEPGLRAPEMLTVTEMLPRVITCFPQIIASTPSQVPVGGTITSSILEKEKLRLRENILPKG